MTKVLMLGFSVTEMPSSYVPRLKSLAAMRGGDLEIDHCGIGGIGTESLPYFVDRIIADRPDAEWIVYEIATSHARDVYRRALETDPGYTAIIWSHLASLIIKARAAGRAVAFVNLPRQDVDYQADMLEATIAQICAGYDVPLLSVSTDLMLRAVPLDTVLSDVVHPTPAGAEIYAEKILDFLLKLGPARHIPPITASPFDSVALKDFAGNNAVLPFRRHGFSEQYVVLEGGQSITIPFAQPTRIDGIAVLVGPKSGWLSMEATWRSDLLFYDEYCYYERMMTAGCPMGVIEQLTISVAPIVPETALLKGEKDEGPRRIGLFYLFSAVP